MSETRKQITFDLDTHALRVYFPSESWQNGYEVIKREMKQNGFEWLQGSTYASKKSMSHVHVHNIIKELVWKYPWLNKCMRDCRETNLGRVHSLNYIFDKEADVMTREEVRRQEKKQDSMGGYMAEIEKARAAKKDYVTDQLPHKIREATHNDKSSR